MNGKRVLLAPASAVLAALFFTLSAQGAEEGGAAGAGTAQIFAWVNFAIWGGALLWLCLKKAPPFFRARAEAIGSAVSKASAAKAAADLELREAEGKLGNLEKEVAERRAYADREAAAEVERIRAATRSDVEKILAAATAEIEAAERTARLELKALAATLAVEGAESLLRKKLTAQTQTGLISDFVKSLGGMPN